MQACLGFCVCVAFKCYTMQSDISKVCWVDSKISYQRKNLENVKVK